MIVKSPAKINLGLNVIRKRDDGYHDLETIFYPVNLFDEISVHNSDTLVFQSSDKNLETPDNLIIKAIQALEKESGREIMLHIYLKKNIPAGAGLGGGSSNAAAVLLLLNNMLNLDIPIKRLSEIAVTLGSDVPFFLNPLPSFAQSRGEILEHLNLKIPYPVLIVNPGIHIPTRNAFENIKPRTPAFNLKEIFLSIPDYYELKNYITNDFESIIFEKYPEIAEIKSSMYYSGAMFALMTGTGSTIYGIYPGMEQAEAAAELFADNYFTFIHSPV